MSGSRTTHTTCDAGELTLEDPAEEREWQIMEPSEGKMTGTPSPTTISTKQGRIAKLAKEAQETFLR